MGFLLLRDIYVIGGLPLFKLIFNFTFSFVSWCWCFITQLNLYNLNGCKWVYLVTFDLLKAFALLLLVNFLLFLYYFNALHVCLLHYGWIIIIIIIHLQCTIYERMCCVHIWLKIMDKTIVAISLKIILIFNVYYYRPKCRVYGIVCMKFVSFKNNSYRISIAARPSIRITVLSISIWLFQCLWFHIKLVMKRLCLENVKIKRKK